MQREAWDADPGAYMTRSRLASATSAFPALRIFPYQSSSSSLSRHRFLPSVALACLLQAAKYEDISISRPYKMGEMYESAPFLVDDEVGRDVEPSTGTVDYQNTDGR